MTYKGREIVKPTLKMFEECCAIHLLAVPPEEVYNHYLKKNWKGNGGKTVSSVEVMCNAWNGVWIQHHKKMKENTIRKKAFQLEILNQAKEEYTAYKDQLEDPNWLAFRNFVFKVRGGKCEICGCKKNLQVHHPRYQKNCKAWEYSCKDVIVVCKDCHEKLHGIKN